MKLRLKTRVCLKNFNEFNRIKSIGFSDKKLAELTNTSEDMIRRKEVLLKFYQYLKKLILVQLNLNHSHLICTQHIKEIFQLIQNVKQIHQLKKDYYSGWWP